MQSCFLDSMRTYITFVICCYTSTMHDVQAHAHARKIEFNCIVIRSFTFNTCRLIMLIQSMEKRKRKADADTHFSELYVPRLTSTIVQSQFVSFISLSDRPKPNVFKLKFYAYNILNCEICLFFDKKFRLNVECILNSILKIQ